MNRWNCFLLFTVVLLCVCACNKQRIQEKPENLIERSRMVEILADSYIIENTILLLPEDSNKHVATVNLYSKLFKDYSITKDQYMSSVEYYLGDKKSADAILKDSEAALLVKKDKFFATHKPDSVENKPWEDKKIEN